MADITANPIDLSPAQSGILQQILDWYFDKNRTKNYLTLGGYAGTGKTTLLGVFSKKVREKEPKTKIAFAAYTGKASRVLYSKLNQFKSRGGDDYVGTLHGLLYTALTNSGGQVVGWEKKSAEKFEYNLIVVDEASMVNQGIWADIQSFGVPILAVGDHGQLPPIEGSFNLMQTPELKLEEIFRQQADNPIIQLSIMARESGRIAPARYSRTVRKLQRDDADAQELLGELFTQYDERLMVLVGYNHTRVKINQAIRQLLEFDSPLPQRRDRVICLKNNRELGIFNGMLGYIDGMSEVTDGPLNYYLMDITFDGEDKSRELKVYKDQFGQKESLKVEIPKQLQVFDFGYAITVHKSQGSQAEKVVLFEERFSRMSDEDWRRWLYTAVTRSSSELYIIGD